MTAMITRPASTWRTTVAFIVLLTASLMFTATPQAQDTPTAAYNAYRKALATATVYTDVFPFMDAKSRAMLEPMPPPTQAKMFELLKRFGGTFTDIAVTRETITGDTAVLELSGKDPKGQAATGSVPMAREASGWKVGTEKWSSKPR